ncbi:restriction endonuclease subunit S [Streptomyces sp. NPDC001832]|uniref:restriction endonuclease subunit S n=1 Tax=Streptomyces sp. NPDC001832 TaxID=3154527 RepID=UPI003321D9B1
MSEKELPAGWAWAELGELANSVKNGIYVSRPGAVPDGVPILRISAVRPMTLDTSDLRYTGMTREEVQAKDGLLEPGDLLFTRYNGNPRLVGSCARVPDGAGALSYPDKLIRVSLPSACVDSRYVCYAWAWSETQRQVRQHVKTTAGQAGIAGSSLKKIRFPLPPLAEQHRIVEALEDHLSRLHAAEADVELAGVKADRLISVVRARAVTGGFSRRVEVDEAMQPSEVHEASRRHARRRWTAIAPTAVPGFSPPENWTVVSLGSLCYESGYGTSTKCAHDAAGNPVLRIPNVQGGSIDLSDVKNAVDESVDLSKYFLSAGDLLFVRTNGSPGLIGRVGVVEEALDAAFASYLIRFRLAPGLVEPRWIHLVTQSPLWRREIERRAASSAGQYNLNIESLSSLPVPLPPVEVQRETLRAVDAKVDAVRRLSRSAKLANARAGHLRNSLLRQAFNGQLIPQDPADEPAPALFARIQAERAAQPKAKHARRAPAPRRAKAPATAVATAAPAPRPTTPAPTHAVQQEFDL